jgi:hypothetical protein
MDANSNVAVALPLLELSLGRLSDDEVLAGTRRLVGRSNLLLAELLAHLAEVETRGIHRSRACSSLYAYCVYELRFSEDEAFRRVAAARLARRFPALLDALASGELHLTGLLMLGPHLTEANLTEVLARAKHRTKRELARLVRVLDPLPAVPARIEPLGPALARAIPADPTWESFVQSFCPVRELTPGGRPRDWMASENDAGSVDAGEKPTITEPTAPARVDSTELNPVSAEPLVPEPLAPERYKVQFTATAEYVRLVEEAKALLSHVVPRAALDEIHLRALRAFVTQLRKTKYATAEAHDRETRAYGADQPAVNGARSMSSLELSGSRSAQDGTTASHPRQRRRHIPAAVRRAVFARDGAQCLTIIHISSSHRRRGVIKRPNGFAPIRSNAGTCKRHEYGLVRRRTPDETVAVDC